MSKMKPMIATIAKILKYNAYLLFIWLIVEPYIYDTSCWTEPRVFDGMFPNSSWIFYGLLILIS